MDIAAETVPAPTVPRDPQSAELPDAQDVPLYSSVASVFPKTNPAF